MASTVAPRHDHSAAGIAAWSALGGLLIVLMTAALSGRLRFDARLDGDTILGALGTTVVLAAPFVAALTSFLSHSTEVRRAVWLASGVLTLVLAGLTIASVGVLLAVTGIGLLAAWWMTRGHGGLLGGARSIVLSGWLILCLGGALAALWLRETPICWSTSGENIERTVCSSDVVDNTEGLLALAGVAIGFGGLVLAARGGSMTGGAAQPGIIEG